jgi:hypothetical protein
MSVLSTARTVCRKIFNSEPSNIFCFFYEGRKIPWLGNLQTLRQISLKDGDTMSWNFSFIRAFIYDSCWYPSPPYKREFQLEYSDSINFLRNEVVEKIGHKSHAFDILYRGTKYHPDKLIRELLPSHRHNRIIFNVVRKPNSLITDFSSKYGKQFHSRLISPTFFPPLTQDQQLTQNQQDQGIFRGLIDVFFNENFSESVFNGYNF